MVVYDHPRLRRQFYRQSADELSGGWPAPTDTACVRLARNRSVRHHSWPCEVLVDIRAENIRVRHCATGRRDIGGNDLVDARLTCWSPATVEGQIVKVVTRTDFPIGRARRCGLHGADKMSPRAGPRLQPDEASRGGAGGARIERPGQLDQARAAFRTMELGQRSSPSGLATLGRIERCANWKPFSRRSGRTSRATHRVQSSAADWLFGGLVEQRARQRARAAQSASGLVQPRCTVAGPVYRAAVARLSRW
jgi:hypothetical protein